MPYLYSKVEDLNGIELVGSHQCVALVQIKAGAPVTSAWREGEIVKGATLQKGTAIATFSNGRYANKSHGNHAALYLGQNSAGIDVMDQWKGDKDKPVVSRRFIRFRGKNKNGDYVNPINNADAYSVVE